jgi:hypothetical protein
MSTRIGSTLMMSVSLSSAMMRVRWAAIQGNAEPARASA